MSTVIESQASPPPGREDPWRLGWRYVRHVGPNGEISCEQIPLTEDGLLFPEEGDFVVTNDIHVIDCNYLYAALKQWAARREGALVLADHRVDWETPGLRALGPDVVVFDGLREKWDINRGTLPVKTFGARTLLVMEVTSPNTRPNDLGIKVEFYHRVGARFYAIVDRRETQQGVDVHLIGYRADPATPDSFVEVEPDERGWIWLETVGLWLGLVDDRTVLFEENGDRIPDYAEAVQEMQNAEARTTAAEGRAAAEADARRLADARAAAAEARAKELEAELQRLRGQSNGASPNGAAP
jgi:colicin import membrane protein